MAGHALRTTVSVTLAAEWKERALRGSWAMYGPEGGRMVAETFIALVEGGVVISRREGTLAHDFGREVFEATALVVAPQHGEVEDTAVRELIWAKAEELLA